MFKKNSHCATCGHRFPEQDPWPRTCTHCGNTTFLNPLPVVVMLVPVDDGLIVIRRNIEPRRGMLALPGGYINLGESWQQAGAREVLEETGIHIDPSEIREFRVRSAEDGTLLIFGLAPPRASTHLPPFPTNDECTERVILKEPQELAFALHTETVRLFFEGRGC